MTQIINGLSTIKRHQTLISDNLKELHSSNQALWQEAMEARERHRKHQDTINRILKFLASLFQGTATTPIRTASMNSNSSANEKNGHVVPAPRLLIKNVPEGDDDHDDRDSTPMSSVRLEEIELLDDDIPSSTVFYLIVLEYFSWHNNRIGTNGGPFTDSRNSYDYNLANTSLFSPNL
jgi:heat shock transcription factor